EKRATGYSLENISGDKLAQSSAPNIINALSGRMAGVVVTQPNGVEGGTTRIVLRGNTSFTGNNQPLIIVDGVEFQNNPGLTAIAGGQDWGSFINNLNPNDIEDMTVLKGPAASALYGAQGGNGVIIITTKKGRKKEGLGVDYALDYRITQPYLYMKMQNVFGNGGPINDLEPAFTQDAEGNNTLPLIWGAQHGVSKLPGANSTLNTYDLFSWYASSVSWGPRMEGQPVKWWDGVIRPFSPQPNNIKGYFRDGSTASHNVSFSNAGELGAIRVSLNRTDNSSVMPNSHYNQTTFNTGANINISPKVKATITATYLDYYRKNSPELGDNADGWGKSAIYYYSREYRDLGKHTYQNPDGTRNNFPGYSDVYWGDNEYIWWKTYNNNIYLDRKTLLGSVAITYDITPYLNLMGRSSINQSHDEKTETRKPINLDGLQDGYYGQNLYRASSNASDVILSFHKDTLAPGLSLTARAAASRRAISNYTLNNYTDNFSIPFFYALSNVKGNPHPVQETFYEKKTNSLYGVIDMAYKNYLFLELTGRNDWFSTLPRNSNSGFYPSASLSFVFTDALKIKSKVLSYGKLRVAAAKAASDRDPYLIRQAYGTGSFAGNVTLTLPDSVPPNHLQPQTSRTYEGGLNVGLFNNRLTLDLTYYNMLAYNQILNAPIAPSTGATTIWFNSGKIQNNGWELQLDAKAVDTKNFRWDIALRMARNKGVIKELDKEHPEVDFLELDKLWDNYGPSIRVRKNDQYGTIYGYDYTYLNGQPVINSDGTRYIPTADKVPIGNATPKVTGGITNTFSYKNFTLSALVDAKIGGDVYSGSYAAATMSGLTPATLKERMGGGLPYTDASGATRNVGVLLPGVYADGTPNKKVVHYLWKYMGNLGAGWGDWIDQTTMERHNFLQKPQVFDNTFVKLRELSLAYSLPQNLLKGQRVLQNLSVSVVARDLCYLYKNLPFNINPEGMNGAGNAQGLEWGALPGMRSFSFQLRAGF
ncbi:MAG TPA: SusC/RagA family TonB-linked outer membrane protein, partial [Chitinophaga sp.]